MRRQSESYPIGDASVDVDMEDAEISKVDNEVDTEDPGDNSKGDPSGDGDDDFKDGGDLEGAKDVGQNLDKEPVHSESLQ